MTREFGELESRLDAILSKSILVETSEGIASAWSAALDRLTAAVSILPAPSDVQTHVTDLVKAVGHDTTVLLSTIKQNVSELANIYEDGALPTTNDFASFHHDIQHAFETYYTSPTSDFTASDFWI